MKTRKSDLHQQRRLIDQKLGPWMVAKAIIPPRGGWLRAVRESLGLTAKDLAKLQGVSPANIINLEKRELEKTVTLESLERAARAMNCRLVYAIVPDKNMSLEDLLDERALKLALQELKAVDHTMALEKQSEGLKANKKKVAEFARTLKEKLDKRLWDTSSHAEKKRK